MAMRKRICIVVDEGLWEDVKAVAKHAGTSACDLVESWLSYLIKLYENNMVYKHGKLLLVVPPSVNVIMHNTFRARRRAGTP